MRGARAFLVLTVYLLLMSGFTALLYVLSSSSRDIAGFATGGTIGRTLFVGIIGIELFLVTFIAPAFTAGAISGERERQTYDLLKTTLLPLRSLIFGKMVSALSYVVLLLLAAIPLQAIAFLFGGISEIELGLSFVILLMTAIALGSIGLYFSAVRPSTLSANIATYAFTLTITIGLPLVVFVAYALFGPNAQLLPVSAQTVLFYALYFLVCTNPLAAAYATQFWLLEKQSIGVFTQTISDGSVITQVPVISPWIPFVILYFLLAIVFLVRTTRRVTRIES